MSGVQTKAMARNPIKVESENAQEKSVLGDCGIFIKE